jgi:hypothetical protein
MTGKQEVDFPIADNRGINGDKGNSSGETRLGAGYTKRLEFPIGDASIGCAGRCLSLERSL